MSKGKIIVTGGCGYIGSHTVVDLIANGYEVVSIDNFSRADKRIIQGIESISLRPLVNHAIDLVDRDAVMKVFNQYDDIRGVIHFAAFKSVPESVDQPILYYRNNMDSLFNILEAVKVNGIRHFVFSSSCSVYGHSQELPVTEETPFGEAQCPYARSKQYGEQVVADVARVSDFKAVLLRYFNPVGAHPSALIGEVPIDVPNNLVPFITQTAIGKRKKLTVFGGDYPTRDGSCIRDYIHVSDIAHAHTLALEYLQSHPDAAPVDVFNLGTGNGFSVLEVVKAFEKVAGIPLNYEVGPRRQGDIMAVYADNSKARNQLGWKIQFDLEQMMLTAWNWEKAMAVRGF